MNRLGWLMAWIVGWAGLVQAQDSPPAARLFSSGLEGYPRYRIPTLLVTPSGSTLAICEGRKSGRGLTGNIDLVVKRSDDRGRTWSGLEVIADDGDHTLGNPCAVVDRSTGTIWLALTRSHGADLEEEIVAGRSRESTRVWIVSSRDEGRTWTPPRDITSAVKRADWTWYGTGPGVGIQLRSGRLFLPCYHAESGTGRYVSHSVFSDDHGQTWQLGGALDVDTSESQVVERSDGALVLSARIMARGDRRQMAESRDGGATWAPARRDPALFDPDCQASLVTLAPRDGALPRWLYTHPAGPEGRRNLTLRVSRDEGKTWDPGWLLRPGDAQYSCLAELPDGAIGCLFESWVDGNYHLYFTRFELP